MKTDRAENAELRQYLSEIGRFQLLTADEELDLARRIAAGDQCARDQMIRSNLRLVVAIAKHYADRGLPLLDIVAEGNLGLLKAVTRFSPEQGCRFSTYAAWWIKQTIRRALADKVETVRIPAYMVDLLGLWRRTSAVLAQNMEREPSFEEVNEVLRLPPRKLTAVRKALDATSRKHRQRAYGEPNSSVENLLAALPSQDLADDGSSLDEERLQAALEYAVTDRERDVLALRFGLSGGEPNTLDLIGRKIGLTRERVRQIESQALKKMRLFFIHEEEREDQARAERLAQRRRREGRKNLAPKEPRVASAAGTVAVEFVERSAAKKTDRRRKAKGGKTASKTSKHAARTGPLHQPATKKDAKGRKTSVPEKTPPRPAKTAGKSRPAARAVKKKPKPRKGRSSCR